jgi:hypothetical protein
MLRRTILLGLAPVMWAGVCVLTAVRSPAVDSPAAKAAADKQAAEKPRPAAERAAENVKAAARLVDRKLAALNKLDNRVNDLMQLGGRGPSGIEFHYTWSKRRLEAEREAAGTAKQRLAAAEAHLARMNRLAQRYQALRGGVVDPTRNLELDLLAADYFVAEAEQWAAAAEAAVEQPR